MRSILVTLLVLGAACRCGPDPERVALVKRLGTASEKLKIETLRALGPGADADEVFAIAAAGQGAPVSVRAEVARALGQAKASAAVDQLGALLRDPSDTVRAATVEALFDRPEAKARSYLVRAWGNGGPRTRMAYLGAPKALLAEAIDAEAARATGALAERREDPRAAVRASAWETVGIFGTDEGLAALVEGLADPNDLVAAGAARGLGLAKDEGAVPALAEALRSKRPLVAPAAAWALGRIGTAEAIPPLVEALADADEEMLADILPALEARLVLDAAEGLCAVALRVTSPTLALQAGRLAGPTCAVAVDDETPNLANRLLLLAQAGGADVSVRRRSLELLDGDDAFLAAAAATWLGVHGDPADAPALVRAAERERVRIAEARWERARAAAEKKASKVAEAESAREHLRALLRQSGNEEGAERIPRVLDSRLAQLLVARKATSELTTPEPRPGSAELVRTAALSAVRLGGRVESLAEALAVEPDMRLRQVAAEMVLAAKDPLESVREILRRDEDPSLVAALAIAEAGEGRAEAWERLLQATPRVDASLRAATVAALGKEPERARSELLRVVRDGTAGLAEAIRAVTPLPGDDVEDALETRLVDLAGQGALEATSALAARAGERATALLEGAAMHAFPEVRAAALAALAARKGCGREGLGAFGRDVHAVVRQAASEWVAACDRAPRP